MSARSTLRILSVAIAVAVAVGAVVLWRSGDRAPAGAVEPPPPARATPAPSAPATPARATPAPASTEGDDAQERPLYRVGMQATYDVRLASTTHFDLGEGMHQQLKDIEVTLSGRWAVTVVEVDGDQVRLLATLATPKLTMLPKQEASDLDVTHRGLVSRHYVTVDRHGTVQATHFPKGIDPMARSLLKSVIAAWQVTLPDQPADAWQAEEQALEGDVLVTYGRLPQGTDGIEKRVVRYLRVAAAGGVVSDENIGSYTVRGRAELTLDPAGWLAQREGTQVQKVAPEGGLLGVEERRSSRFAQIRRADAPALAADLPRDWPSLETSTLVDVQRLASDRDTIDRAWVAGADLRTLLDALHAARGKEGSQDRARLVPRLAALLRLDPAKAADLESLARTQGDTEVTRALMAALSSAGTPEAQEVLASLGGDPTLAPNERLRAVGLLGLSKTPTSASGSTLEGWMASEDADIAETAALALGNHIKRRLEDESVDAPAETADLVQALIKALQAAQTAPEKTLYLKALGNTGDPRAIPAITAELATDDVSVRTAALWALRFMAGAEVDALLVEALTKDPALSPRQAVVAGAAFRSLVPLGPALDRMGRSYPDKALRLDIVHLLGVSKDAYPPGIVTLTWIAQNDGAADVREAAQAALKGQTIPGPKMEVVQ